MASDRLEGHVALVTGSGRNIGRGIALELAAAGAAVVVNGHRDRAALDRVVAEIEAAGGQGLAVLADVSDRDQVNRMVKAAIERFGKVDISVSNVAIRGGVPFLEITPEQWRETLDTNLSAAFHLAQAVLPGMLAQRWGRIIHISGGSNFFAYSSQRIHSMAAKSGLLGLAKGIARDFGPQGITANVVSPGTIGTDEDPRLVAEIALRRYGTPYEIAALCRFLASDGGAYISGQAIQVNGGRHMY